jgi:hypothetical protein
MSYVAPWAATTALAVGLSWLGVHGVVRGAVTVRSTPPPVTGPVISGRPSAPSSGSRQGSDGAWLTAPGLPRASGTRGPARDVRSYSARGGRAALAISDRTVRLVSATPNTGYATRVTPAADALRVDFIGAENGSSVVASYFRRHPTVQVYEY